MSNDDIAYGIASGALLRFLEAHFSSKKNLLTNNKLAVGLVTGHRDDLMNV